MGTDSRKEENASGVKTGDAGGRASWRSSLLGDPGVKFFDGKLGK